MYGYFSDILERQAIMVERRSLCQGLGVAEGHGHDEVASDSFLG